MTGNLTKAPTLYDQTGGLLWAASTALLRPFREIVARPEKSSVETCRARVHVNNSFFLPRKRLADSFPPPPKHGLELRRGSNSCFRFHNRGHVCAASHARRRARCDAGAVTAASRQRSGRVDCEEAHCSCLLGGCAAERSPARGAGKFETWAASRPEYSDGGDQHRGGGALP